MTEQSPGVSIQEVDDSVIAPSVSNTVSVFAGEFTKGPIRSFLVTSVDELIMHYGLPTDENYNQFYQAYNFLQYGNTLYISRAINKESLNASAEIGPKIPITIMYLDNTEEYKNSFNRLLLIGDEFIGDNLIDPYLDDVLFDEDSDSIDIDPEPELPEEP